MRALIIALLLLAACTAAQPPAAEQQQCKVFEAPDGKGGCCRDLNENGICDTIDYAGEIAEQKQQEYEESAEKARETAAESGRLRRTIVNDLYDAAAEVKEYRFLYKGDEVVIANGTIVRNLLADYPLGDQDIEGRRVKVVINQVAFDFAAKQAMGECMPPAHLVRLNRGTQCDAVIGKTFPVSYDEFSFRLPIEWLKDLLHRTPYETIGNQDIGKLKTTLYRFTDLKDAQRKTNIWVDEVTKMPVRVEVRQGDNLERQEYYTDLYSI
jgi:hypothetical protein